MPRNEISPVQLFPQEARLPLAAIVACGAALRVAFLDIFPKIQADEGLWTSSTKNFLLFGDWFMDGRSHLFLSPMYHFLTSVAFGAFGPSLEAARLVSAAAGTATILLVYLLGLRLTQNLHVALIAAAVLAFDPWAVVHSRQAMTEAVLVLFVVASAVMVVGRTREVALAGVLFACAILTKLNAAAMGIALGGYLLLRDPPGLPQHEVSAVWRRRLLDGVIFGVIALGLAGIGYWAVAQIDPERFVAVFQRELGGQHLVEAGQAAPASGRLGLHPITAGKTLLEILRLNPFLLPFAGMGAVITWASPTRGRELLTIWVVVGLTFPLVQIYQPVRYFFPVVPALAILVGIFCSFFLDSKPAGRRVTFGAVALVLAYSTAYVATNFAANRDDVVVVVDRWIHENTSPDEPLLLSAYLATNPPNRAFAYDIYASTEESLVDFVATHEIRYVIWDNAEWSPQMREVLESRYTRVATWSFGAAFKVTE